MKHLRKPNQQEIITLCCALAFWVGLLVLVGWKFDLMFLKSVIPGFISMKANTAVGFISLSLSIWLLRAENPRKRILLIGFASASVAFLVGAGSLLEYLSGLQLHIDELFCLDPAGIKEHFPPGRPAPISSINFVLIVMAIFLIKNPWRKYYRISQFLTLTAFLMSFQALIGYFCGISYSFGKAYYTQMAIHTAALFVVTCTGLLLSNISRGFMAVFIANTAGGATARRLIGAAILIPPLINWIQVAGQNAGYYDADFGVLIRITGNVLFFILLVWKNATEIHKTDLKRSEVLEAHKASEAQLRLVTDGLPALIAYVDTESRYQFANLALQKTFGLPLSKVIGSHMGDLLGKEEYQKYQFQAEKALAGQNVEFQSEMAFTQGGKRILNVNYVPDRIEGGKIRGFVVLASDITERVHFEEERAKSVAREQAALESSRLKSEFLANMSHEIRTPLNGVIGMTGLLLDTPLNPEQKEYSENARRSAESLLTVINDILDFSKIEANKLELELVQFDLEELIKDTMKMLTFSARKKALKFKIQFPENFNFLLMGDPGRIRQIVTNLLSNAIKFTQAGGIDCKVITLGIAGGKINLRFEISDSGIGISEKAMEGMFQAFCQADSSTSRRFGGTGLGLSICKKLVGLMGGNIGVTSEENVGSTFWFELSMDWLPRSSRDTYATQKSIRIHTARPARILVAEDNFINQKITVKLLEKIGHKAEAVANGSEVINALREIPYDLVLMDCQMPELDGYETTRLIRNSGTSPFRNIPIIAMTANALSGDREKCLEAGMNDYISKPVNLENLARVLENWLQSRAAA